MAPTTDSINQVRIPMNYWWPILEAKSLRQGEALGIKRFGKRLALWRTSKDEIFCLEDRCPHRGTSFTAPKGFPRDLKKVAKYSASMRGREKDDRVGRVVDDKIQCPYHGLRFDGNGKCHKLPFSNRPDARVPKGLCGKSYLVKEAHGCIWLWWGAANHATETIPWFDFLPTAGHMACYATQIQHWNYLRGVEQMLDTVHFPVLHAGTAKSFKLGGPILTRFESWEQGSGPDRRIMVNMKLSEADGQTKKMKLLQEAIFPHTVCSSFTPNDECRPTRIFFVASQVPVDTETTYVFYRYYYATNPQWLARIIARFLLRAETHMVSGEDVRAVTSQFPDDGIGTNVLLEPDKAYMLYERRWCRELKAQEVFL